MLTVKQPPIFGYKSVYDLPTPPSTSRPSPPLGFQETCLNNSSAARTATRSPSAPPMSVPHRSLPPPAGMPFPPQPPPAAATSTTAHPAAQVSHHNQPQPSTQAQAPSAPGHAKSQSWASLPPPPQQWQGTEDSMRNWLQAKTEEEKTRQEEERTRQESLRLEQRKIEMDILRESLGRGIPPPMVPMVFAGMSGGVLPQAALDWAQQFMSQQQTQATQQLMPPNRPPSPEPLRDTVGQVLAHGASSTAPGQTASGAGYGQYPGSPSRSRGQTISGSMNRQSIGPSTITSQPGQSAVAGGSVYQGHSQGQMQSSQQDSSPSIYFHHWQPPASQGGGGGGAPNRPGSPSGDIQRKRKATGPQHSVQTTNDRLRSPPTFVQSSLSNPPISRKGHKRQRSDISWYRSPGQGHSEDGGRHTRAMTPLQGVSTSSSRDRDREEPETRKHSVSSLLSVEPTEHGAAPQQISHWQQAGSRYRDSHNVQRHSRTPPAEADARRRSGAGSSAEGDK